MIKKVYDLEERAARFGENIIVIFFHTAAQEE